MLFSLGVFTIFFLCLENAAADERYILRGTYSLLGVIWNNMEFKLATPTKYQDEYFAYTYDPSKGEEFIAACPIPAKRNILIKRTQITNGYYNYKCEYDFKPTLKSIEKTCHEESKALLYGVGYDIRIPNNVLETKFLDVYRICIIDKNTYFTIHDVDPTSVKDDITQDSKAEFVYQFVPFLDMQTYALKITTMNVDMNNTDAPKHKRNYLYLRDVDEAIRNYIEKYAHKTRIYSGLYETNEEKKTCKHIFKVLQFQTESNDENAGNFGFAVITRFNSPEDCSKICQDNEIKFSVPENKEGLLQSLRNTFHHKPFAYACKVDQNLIIAFKLNNFINKEMETPSSSQNNDVGVTSFACSGSMEVSGDGGCDW